MFTLTARRGPCSLGDVLQVGAMSSVQRLSRGWCSVASLLALVACSGARQGGTPDTASAASSVSISGARASSDARPKPRIVVELHAGATPWTHLDASNAKDTFRFAIVTDRTGGMRSGVFESAVTKLNLLQPEFVVSVGDLIDGYTEDRELLQRQWDEFDAVVNDLEAPFFYVPGNHDITNGTMREVWHERYGPSRYAFVYQDVLFVCLDSMDGGMHQISSNQVQWLKAILDTHRDVHWTLLFLHTPLWDQADEGLSGSWGEVMKVLGKRNYTAFAGHYHRYTKHVRNDRKHFTLATTGGGSFLRGPRYGEFDHVVWVTMSPRGPRIANLMLDGIWDEDVRTLPIAEFQKQALQRSLHPAPIFHAGGFERGKTEVKLHNPHDYPYEVELKVDAPRGLVASAAATRATVEPNSVLQRTLELHAGVPIAELAFNVPLRWRAHAEIQAQDVVFEGEVNIGVVQLLNASRPQRTPSIDAELDDWPRLRFDVEHPAQVQRQAEARRGTDDSRFWLDVAHDDAWLYVAVEVHDDDLRAEAGVEPWEQDGVEIRIDARPDPQRSNYGGARDGQDVLVLALSPSDDAADVWLRTEPWMKIPQGVRAACVRTPKGFIAEVAVPRAWAVEASGGSLERIRVNVAVDDRDADGLSQSWWWPDWRSPEQIPGSGTFVVSR